MTGSAAIRLTLVHCDAHASHMRVTRSLTAREFRLLARLRLEGHGDLAFDILCEMVRKRRCRCDRVRLTIATG